MDLTLYIDEHGGIEHVYDDALADLFEGEGDVTVTRASHVEPHPLGGGWLADMRPVGGPILGANGPGDGATVWINYHDPHDHGIVPFKTRAEALAAERAWLDTFHFAK